MDSEMCIRDNAARLSQVVPKSSRQPYDMVEVIRILVDYGEFVQVQEMFTQSITVGFAAFDDESVRTVANNPMHEAGTLNVDASEKAVRFVQFCDAFNVPVVTLVDVPGYRPGTEQEHAGVIRRGVKLIRSCAMATVPLATVALRKAYRGAYVIMGSKSLGGDFSYAWPEAETAVLGTDSVMTITGWRELKKATEEGKDVATIRAEFVEKYTHENVNPHLSIESGQLDAIITPETTRSSVVPALRTARTKNRSQSRTGHHGNMPM